MRAALDDDEEEKEESAVTNAIAPEGRRLLRVEARNAQTPIERKPKWLQTRAVISETYQEVRGLIGQKRLHTVCVETNFVSKVIRK